MSKDGRRLIPRNACSWCGHARHAAECGQTVRVRVQPESFAPCSCARRAS